MARIKPDTSALITIESWEKADQVLRDLGDLQLKVAGAEAKAKDDINEVKAELAETVKLFGGQQQQYVRSLEAFAAGRRAEFGGQKSRQLNQGVIGWRKSTSIRIKKNTLELIKEIFSRAKWHTFIHTKETVDKEALGKLKDEELEEIGARRLTKNIFFAEPNQLKAVDYVE